MMGPTPKWHTCFSAFKFLLVLCALAALFPEGGLAQEKQRPIELFRMHPSGGELLDSAVQHGKQRLIELSRTRFLSGDVSGTYQFLFLYQEGSISPEELKRFVERAELVIKTKSSPKDRITDGQPAAIEEMTLEELAATISPGAKRRPIKGKAVAEAVARLSTLFKTYGPVLVLNFTRNAGRAMATAKPARSDFEVIDAGGARATATPPSEFELIPLPVSGTPSGENLKTVVITFGLTSGTEDEFISLFCRLYHGDCGGPIGKPIPLPADPVTVRKYARLNWERPIEDKSQLIQALLPFSAPPRTLMIVLPDGRACKVENLDWVSADGSIIVGKKAPKGTRWCRCGPGVPGGEVLCPNTWSCKDCCDVIKKAFESKTFIPPEQAPEIKELLRELGLRQSSARPKPYPIDHILLGADAMPDQRISCMRKDAQGNCIHWRICAMIEGIERCYDVVKDPAFGWVVLW